MLENVSLPPEMVNIVGSEIMDFAVKMAPTGMCLICFIFQEYQMLLR